MMLPKKRTHNCNTSDALFWRFSKDTRNILTLTSLGQLVLFAKNTLSFLLLVLGSQDNISRVPLACLSPRRILDSKWIFSLTPFRYSARSNFSHLFLFLFSKWSWLAIAIFQPEPHPKSLQCSNTLIDNSVLCFLTETVLPVGLYTYRVRVARLAGKSPQYFTRCWSFSQSWYSSNHLHLQFYLGFPSLSLKLSIWNSFAKHFPVLVKFLQAHRNLPSAHSFGVVCSFTTWKTNCWISSLVLRGEIIGKVLLLLVTLILPRNTCHRPLSEGAPCIQQFALE